MAEVRYRLSPTNDSRQNLHAGIIAEDLDGDTTKRKARVVSRQRMRQARLILFFLGATCFLVGIGAIGQIIIICGLQGERRNTKNIPRGRRLSNLSRPRASTGPIKNFILPDTSRDRLYEELSMMKVNTSDLAALEAFIETSKSVIWEHISVEIFEALLALHDIHSATSAVLFKNIPVDPFVPPTPTDGSNSLRKPTYIAEAMLVGLGELTSAKVIGYASETKYSNPWIHEGFPRNNSGSALTKATDLSFHQDMSYHHRPPDILGLVCLREGHDRQVRTELIDNRDVFNLLPTSVLDVLQQSRFQIRTSEWVDTRWSGANNDGRPLVEDATSIRLPVDWENMVGLDEAAQRAVEFLKRAIEYAPKHYVHFGHGDLLLFSNRRMVHARTPYTDLRFDGGDRVLNRAYFLKALTPEEHPTRIA